MHRERRLIWAEDRYELLGRNGLDRYYGRAKGDFYFVYRKRGESVRREILQVVEGDQDWYWDSISNRLVGQQVMAAAEPAPLGLPNEHVLRGYLNSNRIENLCTSVEPSEIQLRSGATAIILTPPEVREWVISLHGGPESLEGTEIRYGGLYRELLRQGSGVVILNYRGSTGVAKPDSISWKTSIEEDFDSLLEILGSKTGFSLLGASFGGALALLLSKTRAVKKTLLISPLLDLTHQRWRGGAEFQAWFDSKFSEIDFHDISLAELARGITESGPRVGLIYGSQDEVLGQEMFAWLAAVLRVQARHLICQHNGPHQPVTYRDVGFQLAQSYKFLTESTDAVC